VVNLTNGGVGINVLELDLLTVFSYTFDLAKAVPYYAMPEEDRKNIWYDGTHFTAQGYDLAGTKIASRLAEVITAEISSPASKYEQIEL
jgi:lysophospholipase L1-like esterase